MTPSVFICAAFQSAPLVRTIHSSLRAAGIACLSEWADFADDEAEDLGSFSLEERQRMRDENFEGINECDVVLFLADTPAREGFIEVCHAIFNKQKPVIWIGRDTLSTSAERLPVIRVATPLEAIEVVRDMARGKLVA